MNHIHATDEFKRIAALPVRVWSEKTDVELATFATEAFKTPGGSMRLKPIQARMLLDMQQTRGLLAPVKVGGGKTLVSLLAPTVLGAKRPLLLVPAKLVEKAKREIRTLAQHWQIANYIRIVSYQQLGRVDHHKLLTDYQPDLIVADEAHKLKNQKAAVTRVVRDYMHESKCMFVGLSGTFARKRIQDYAHMLLWASRFSGNFCLPIPYWERDLWASVLNVEYTRGKPRANPGALQSWCPPSERDFDPYITARRGYRARFVATPGIVVSPAIDDADCSLVVSDCVIDEEQTELDAMITAVRRTYKSPDGYSLATPLQVWQLVIQIAHGFYYRPIERPPDEWYEARKVWADFVSSKLRGDLYTPHAVALAYPDAPERLDWVEWKRRIGTVEMEAVWISDAVVDYAIKWMHEHPRGIVWSDFEAFGARVAAKSGRPFFGEQGMDRTGRIYLEDYGAKGKPSPGPIICSGFACVEGFNLQHSWSDNLVIPFGASDRAEQQIGRTHRFEQPADEVTVDYLINCTEHAEAIRRCLAEAVGIQDRESSRHKLLSCDLALNYDPETLARREGGRWNSNQTRDQG